MQFIVVTGMSGSGKTQVLRFLEDKGFFCVDNMPPVLIEKFVEMSFSASGKFDKIAFVIDARVGDMINQLIDDIKKLRDGGYDCKLVFIDADNEVLVKRYKETRKAHPIHSKLGLLGSIQEERKMLEGLYAEADYVINTSNITIAELNKQLDSMYYGADHHKSGVRVNVLAFGFKYGVPLDADLVFDVRCFPNPFYIDELKNKTGNDKEVRDYVMSFEQTKIFFEKLTDLMCYMIPLYVEEGKTNITIAIGCTGGKHRSVTIANELGKVIEDNGYSVNMIYRDISRGV